MIRIGIMVAVLALSWAAYAQHGGHGGPGGGGHPGFHQGGPPGQPNRWHGDSDWVHGPNGLEGRGWPQGWGGEDPCVRRNWFGGWERVC